MSLPQTVLVPFICLAPLLSAVNNFALWQAFPESSLFREANQLTLTGALVVAVVVLWRALTRKDKLVTASIKMITEALSQTADSNRELRKIIEESVVAKRDLIEVIDHLRRGLGMLPCSRIAETVEITRTEDIPHREIFAE